MTEDQGKQLAHNFVKATDADVKDVVNFMLTDFLNTEPLNNAINLQADEAREFFEEIIEAGLSCPVNYILRDSSGQIIAVRWACVMQRHDAANDYVFDSSCRSWKVNEIGRLLSTIEKKTWELVPNGVDKLLSWLVLSVSKDHTRQGIARKLLTHRLEEVREMGCHGLITTASAYNSQQLFKKLGYEELLAINLVDWRDDKNQQIFKCSDKTEKAALYLKLF